MDTLLNIVSFQENSEINLVSGKETANEKGIRIFINGIKRLFPISEDVKFEEEGIKAVQQFLCHLNKYKQIKSCFNIYYLTGWIP